MSLRDDKQQNLQLKLDFSSALTGAARDVAREETESLMATSGPESPARTNRLMEEVCERENLKEALRQVKANKGSAGVDGITVNQLTDYLKQHWPAIREQLLNGTYDRWVLAQPTRTAVYGPVRTVVWQGSAGDRRPNADQVALCESIAETLGQEIRKAARHHQYFLWDLSPLGTPREARTAR